MQFVRLDAVAEIFDCPHSTPNWTEQGVIVLRNQYFKDGLLDLSAPSYTTQASYTERVRRAKPETGDIVLTREAPMGRVARIPDGLTCCLGQRMVLIKPKSDSVNKSYLYYALRSRHVQEQIAWSDGTGSVVSNLRIPSIKSLMIALPPQADQDRAVKILELLDKKIERNNSTNDTVELMGQAMFKYYFAENPESTTWKEERVSDLIGFEGGSQPPKHDHLYEAQDGYVRFIQNRDYASDKHKTYIPISSRNKLCGEYDIMMDKYGEAGKVRFGIAGAYNVALAKIKPIQSNTQEFLRAYFSLPGTQVQLEAASAASTRSSLNATTFAGLIVRVPPAESLQQFEKLQKKMLTTHIKNRAQTQHLMKFRDILLDYLIAS